MTSVKGFRIEREANREDLGRGSFVFTDSYSVFDWGRMPDRIASKGASLCSMGASTFETLENEGIPTHYRGVLTNGSVEAFDDVAQPPREMAIELTQVPDLTRTDGVDSGADGSGYDYGDFHEKAGKNYLVPLEVVFRNTVPVGSSLRRRTTPEAVGLDGVEGSREDSNDGDPDDGGSGNGDPAERWPEGTVELPEPIVEFSTKFEESDRYLDREEADRIAGLADLDTLEALARDVNRVVTERAEAAGFAHQDGKIECLYHDGDLRVADVAGTFDENRFSYDGQQVSKEVLRQYHRTHQPEWVAALETAKAETDTGGDWRGRTRDPEALPEHVLTAVARLYAAGANAYLDRPLFDAPGIEDAVGAVRDL